VGTGIIPFSESVKLCDIQLEACLLVHEAETMMVGEANITTCVCGREILQREYESRFSWLNAKVY
jgi:hypothetical protein